AGGGQGAVDEAADPAVAADADAAELAARALGARHEAVGIDEGVTDAAEVERVAIADRPGAVVGAARGLARAIAADAALAARAGGRGRVVGGVARGIADPTRVAGRARAFRDRLAADEAC